MESKCERHTYTGVHCDDAESDDQRLLCGPCLIATLVKAEKALGAAEQELNFSSSVAYEIAKNQSRTNERLRHVSLKYESALNQSAILQDSVRVAKDLLAVVHRDGGHHTEKVGFHQSCQDAGLEFHRLRSSVESTLLGNANDVDNATIMMEAKIVAWLSANDYPDAANAIASGAHQVEP